jgi:hypothetical protein
MRVRQSEVDYRKRFVVCFVALILLSNSPAFLARQSNSSSPQWAAVQALSPGTKVVVKDKSRRTSKGLIVSVTADSLTLQDKQTSITLDRPQIAKIQLANGRSLGRSTLIGAGIGAGTGVATAGVLLAIAGTEDAEDGEVAAIIGVVAVIGATAGTVGGLLSGLFARHPVIYESR